MLSKIDIPCYFYLLIVNKFIIMHIIIFLNRAIKIPPMSIKITPNSPLDDIKSLNISIDNTTVITTDILSIGATLVTFPIFKAMFIKIHDKAPNIPG